MDELKKELLEEAKKKGLDIAEDGLKNLAEFVFDMLPKIAEKSENSYDDILVPMLMMVKPKVMELIDQIDGQEG